MRFTLCAAVAACGAMAARPELSRAGVSKSVATLEEIMSKMSTSGDTLASIEAASAQLTTILAETAGPADDHVSDADAEILRKAIDLVVDTIYDSMDDSHTADAGALAQGVKEAADCNSHVLDSQSETEPAGVVGQLHIDAKAEQTELDRLKGIWDDKKQVNTTKHQVLVSLMNMMPIAPICSSFPAKTKAALDAYFEDTSPNSEYSSWYEYHQDSFVEARDAWSLADTELVDAIAKFDTQTGVRDTKFCDYKTELLFTCVEFDDCFSTKTSAYTDGLVVSVTKDMNNRIKVKEAGDTLVHQIKFLLSEVDDQAAPAVDVSRYELTFPELPAKALCDKIPLEAPEWRPFPPDFCHHSH